MTAFLVGSTLVAFTTALATGFVGGLTAGFATGLVATGTGAFTGGLQAVAASLDLTTAGFFAVGLGLPCGESNLSVGCSSRAPSSGELDFLSDFFLIAGLSAPLFRFFALMSKNIDFSFRDFSQFLFCYNICIFQQKCGMECGTTAAALVLNICLFG